MKRWLSLLTLLLLLAFPACAEQETRVIDQITYPDAEPEFAFARMLNCWKSFFRRY